MQQNYNTIALPASSTVPLVMKTQLLLPPSTTPKLSAADKMLLKAVEMSTEVLQVLRQGYILDTAANSNAINLLDAMIMSNKITLKNATL